MKPTRSPLLHAANPYQRHGAVAVEFAVIAGVLFTVIFGIIELARTIMVANYLNQVAREGCRAASLTGSSTDGNTITTNDINPKLEVLNATGGTSSFSVNYKVNGTVAPIQAAASGDSITVLITVQYNQVSWMPHFVSGTLQGQYTLVKE